MKFNINRNLKIDKIFIHLQRLTWLI